MKEISDFDVFADQSTVPRKGNRFFVALPSEISDDDIITLGVVAFTENKILRDQVDIVSAIQNAIEKKEGRVRLRLWESSHQLLPEARNVAESMRRIYREIRNERLRMEATFRPEETAGKQ